MRQFFAHVLILAVDRLGEFRWLSSLPGKAAEPVGVHDQAEIIKVVKPALSECRRAGLLMTATTLAQLHDLCGENRFTYRQLRELCAEFSKRFDEELSSYKVFQIDRGDIHYYEGSSLFGEPVSAAFPSAVRDIEEAGKCIALRRSTAVVFHLMRALEVVLHVLGPLLETPHTENKTWKIVLDRMQKTVETKSASKRWKAKNGEFYSGMIAMLRSLKDAWRNPTMHVRGNYSEEEALQIFHLAKGFMQHAAKRLKERRK